MGESSVFPLWGMLGTVVALLALAGNMTADEVPVDQFFGALTTTAFGIVCAILFKSLDSVVSVKVNATHWAFPTKKSSKSGYFPRYKQNRSRNLKLRERFHHPPIRGWSKANSASLIAKISYSPRRM
ncbi:MAG: MotA/TolQ/ExbB proton channel family protein [Oscillospiraceae bacterium]|nr:MotA/TolQ/ExbB proton channel family protein [Oscillospiraceae bacterium]